jgi:hypothetical protein
MSEKAEKVGRVFSICFAVVNAVTFILLLSGFLRVRAHFGAIFKDLLEGASLPMLTAWFLAISPTVLTVVAIVLLALLIAKEWLRPVWIPMFLNALWLALGAALCLLFVVAMMLPLLNIMIKLDA